MQIGTVKIESKLALAPMAGVTDAAFRQICSEKGAGYTVTELVSAKALCYHDTKTAQLLRPFPGEKPFAAQIFGSDVNCMAEAAQMAGVETSLDYATFQNYGYMGLYGGLKAQDIKRRKGLKKSQDILDHMGSTELAANLFRATQTDEKLRRENVQGKDAANRTHYEVGAKVRQTIAELGGTMPEDLPTPEKSVKQLAREQEKQLKK